MRRRLTGISRGKNLTAIRHRYPRIRDYVRSVRGYQRHEEASDLSAARQRQRVLANFAANDSLLDAIFRHKTTRRRPMLAFISIFCRVMTDMYR